MRRPRVPTALGRRSFVAGLAALPALSLLGASGCATRAIGSAGRWAPLPPPGRPSSPGPLGPVSLWSWFDLPHADPRSRELSGLAWDGPARTLWAVQDEAPVIVGLVPDAELRTWQLGASLPLACGGPVDLEALALVPGGFLVASEKGPRVFEVDRQGRLRREYDVPPRFATARKNRSLESLAASPSGRFVFTTSESTLSCDGAMATAVAGAHVRLLRFDRANPADATEHVYLTDPLPYAEGDWGVADLAALSDDELLVLERGWTPAHGNTVRVYRVSLADARASCGVAEDLGPDHPAVAKRLVCDLARLDATGLPPPGQPQATALLDNYEGLALGPRLPDGRPTLLLVSDDNGRADQVARLLVLACG